MMYCPKCGVPNLEDAKFCRACGADVSLVARALSGSAPGGALEATGPGGEARRQRKAKADEPPTLEGGLENLFSGIAFVIIFVLGFLYFTSGFMLWVWLIIPGLAYIGSGIGQIIRWRLLPDGVRQASAHGRPAPLVGGPRAALSAPDTSEIIPPPAIATPVSVTEQTTRDLARRDSRSPA
jgi:hypothetical protein